MFHRVAGQIKFEEMSAVEYENKFWSAMGGKQESIAAQLDQINAIETARLNGHSPQQLAEIVSESAK